MMRRLARHGSTREQGFTLLELLVVLVLLALAATLAFPLANRSRSGLVLRAAAFDVAAELRATRTAALRSNSERTFNVDLQTRYFWSDARREPRPIAHQLALDVVVPSSEQTGPTSARLRFFPDGSSSGGTILIKEPGRVAKVSVDWLTGTPRVDWSR